MGIRQALPLRQSYVQMFCDNFGQGHFDNKSVMAEHFEAPALSAAIEAAARDAAEELLRRARAEGWRVSEDGESALCPACCAGQGGG